MIAELIIHLESNDPLSQQMSSLFHGALMELLPGSFASDMHESKLHPYTQHLEFRQGQWYWIVCTLNEQATSTIVYGTLLQLDSIVIKKRNMSIKLGEKNLTVCSHRELADQFYYSNTSRYIQLQFVTPTAFKKKGNYLFYPDVRCVYQSLMSKYNAAVERNEYVDEEVLEALYDNSEIIKYNLRSTVFYMEGVRIPSFTGRITIRLRGTQTMANFANTLFKFGTFSGVGIKTTIGMGAYHILEGRKESDGIPD